MHPAVALACSGVVIAAVVLLLAHEWRGWHTGLFVWGLAVIVVAVLLVVTGEVLAIRGIPDSPETAMRRLRVRPGLAEANFFVLGIGAAVLSSGTGWVAVDVGLTVVVLLLLGNAVLVAAIVGRRQRRASDPPSSDQAD